MGIAHKALYSKRFWVEIHNEGLTDGDADCFRGEVRNMHNKRPENVKEMRWCSAANDVSGHLELCC